MEATRRVCSNPNLLTHVIVICGSISLKKFLYRCPWDIAFCYLIVIYQLSAIEINVQQTYVTLIIYSNQTNFVFPFELYVCMSKFFHKWFPVNAIRIWDSRLLVNLFYEIWKAVWKSWCSQVTVVAQDYLHKSITIFSRNSFLSRICEIRHYWIT